MKKNTKHFDYAGFAPDFDDITASFRAMAKQPAGLVKEAREVLEIARAFTDEVVRPSVAALEAAVSDDPDYLPWDFVKQANEWELYTMFIPRMFGGRGYSFSCVNFLIEEIGSVCLAMANLVGVHYLGVGLLMSSWNLRLSNRIAREVVSKQKKGEPCLISLAMTEPDAGTDSQNIELMNTGNLGCIAQKVPGGYTLTGNKIFISNGHLSAWHVVHAYTDAWHASENTVMLLVKADAAGFSLGKKENKMGQKGCPASELIFKDCFVPDDQVCIDNEQLEKLKRSPEKTNEQIFAYIWGASRISVGAFGVAAARGAYESALKFCSETSLQESRLINQEWCQTILARMYCNVSVARAACFEATQANALHGLWKLMNLKPIYYAARFTPGWLFKGLSWLLNRSLTTALIRKICLDHQTDSEIDRVDGWGSIAKVTGTDAGMENCRLALELMGQAGVRQDNGLEKIVRDTRLLQIYEGTNEINRLNVFKRMIQRSCPDAELFSKATI
ncbi:MAG: acyl-CoA dehydrogenase family protein [bacterium]